MEPLESSYFLICVSTAWIQGWLRISSGAKLYRWSWVLFFLLSTSGGSRGYPQPNQVALAEMNARPNAEQAGASSRLRLTVGSYVLRLHDALFAAGRNAGIAGVSGLHDEPMIHTANFLQLPGQRISSLY
jgi:hypothetical protein